MARQCQRPARCRSLKDFGKIFYEVSYCLIIKDVEQNLSLDTNRKGESNIRHVCTYALRSNQESTKVMWQSQFIQQTVTESLLCDRLFWHRGN